MNLIQCKCVEIIRLDDCRMRTIQKYKFANSAQLLQIIFYWNKWKSKLRDDNNIRHLQSEKCERFSIIWNWHISWVSFERALICFQCSICIHSDAIRHSTAIKHLFNLCEYWAFIVYSFQHCHCVYLVYWQCSARIIQFNWCNNNRMKICK